MKEEGPVLKKGRARKKVLVEGFSDQGIDAVPFLYGYEIKRKEVGEGSARSEKGVVEKKKSAKRKRKTRKLQRCSISAEVQSKEHGKRTDSRSRGEKGSPVGKSWT